MTPVPPHLTVETRRKLGVVLALWWMGASNFGTLAKSALDMLMRDLCLSGTCDFVSFSVEERSRGRSSPRPFRHHIPPDARFQRKNQKVAEASKSKEKQLIRICAQTVQK